MELNRKLIECMASAADEVTIDQIVIGLGYTAVTTSDGNIGLSATGVAMQGGCCGSHDVEDFETRPAVDLLQKIAEDDPLVRTMALALINALNRQASLQLAEDPDNAILFNRFNILSGARVAMVGYFPPLVRILESRKVPLAVIDDARGIGDKENFYQKLHGWADVLLMTATSIINQTTETILSHCRPGLKTILLGPTTPMVPDAFTHLPIHMLAGTAVTDRAQALKHVRHGGGARSLKSVSRRVYQLTDTDDRTA